MQESFLHFIWQFQYFDKTALKTIDGEMLNIIHPGILNPDAGPDFMESKLKINNISWYGQTEIHIKSSDWNAHSHMENSAYNNVALHVVWENDQSVLRKDGSKMPTLELKGRVDPCLIDRYQSLVNSLENIPCANSLSKIKNITMLSMLDKALLQRLQLKSGSVWKLLQNNYNNWESTTYQLLAANFGFKVNKEAFIALSKAMPLKIIAKHTNNLTQVEALLFGQAGFLDNNILNDTYFNLLRREYSFLSHKYQLHNHKMGLHYWKFLRLRPANFPTVRIAQLASVLHHHPNLFSLFLSLISYKDLIEKFDVSPSSYWQKHYHFRKESKKLLSGPGRASIENIAINTVATLMVSYGKYCDDQQYTDKAIRLLEEIPPEKNRITRLWESVGVRVKNAFDSQALIELYNNFCAENKCLSCNIGVSILKDSEA